MNSLVEKEVVSVRRAYRRSDCSLQPKTAFGQALVALMKRKGWDRADLSRATGVAWSTIDRWMRTSVPHQRNVEWCARKLNVSVEELGGVSARKVNLECTSVVPLVELISELNPQASAKPAAAIVELNPAFEPKEPAPNSARPDAVSMADTKPEWVFRCQFALRCLGVEQRALAKRMGVHQVSFSRWMRGKSPPKPVNLHLIAQILEVPLVWLLRGEGDAEVRAALAKRLFPAL